MEVKYRIVREVKSDFRNGTSDYVYFPRYSETMFVGNKNECAEWLRKKLFEINDIFIPLIEHEMFATDYTHMDYTYEISNFKENPYEHGFVTVFYMTEII